MKTELEIREALCLCRGAGILFNASAIIATLKYVLGEESSLDREVRDLSRSRDQEKAEEVALRYVGV